MKTKQLPKTCAKGTMKAVGKVSVVKMCRIGPVLLTFWVALVSMVTLNLASPIWAANEQKEQGFDVIRSTLDNGLKVVIVRHPLGSVVTTVVNYLAGSNEALKSFPSFPGIAHAQEHMMGRGSPELSADALTDIIAFMGDNYNADTTQTRTRCFFTVPAKYLDVVLHIEAIRMRDILDNEELWQQERGVIEQDLAKNLQNENYFVQTKLCEKMFKGTPYAFDPQGTLDSFNKTNGAMLKKFFDTWYAPNNAILLIVGNVQPEKSLALVKKYFDNIPRKELPKRLAIQPQPVKPLQLKTNFSGYLATIAFRMPGYDNSDYAASQVLADILDRKYNNGCDQMSEKKGPSMSFGLYTLPKAGLGYVKANCPQGSSAEDLMKEMKKNLTEDIEKGFSDDLVNAAKNYERVDAEIKKNSVYDWALLWSDVLAVEGRQSPEDDLKAIEAVTGADVNRVARKYLDFGKAIEVIFTPEVSGKTLSPKEDFAVVKSPAPQQTRTVKVPGWAEKALKEVPIFVSSLNPQESTLPNGIKLIVQPVPASNTISVYGNVENQPCLQVPEGHEGVGEILDQLFSCGTTTLDCQRFQKALDEIGANESAGTDFSLQVVTKDFDRGVQLLADNMLHPAFPERAFKMIQTEIADQYQNTSSDDFALINLNNARLPQQDWTLRQTTSRSVAALSLKDVKDYYEKVFRPDLTTIVVIGKVTPKEAKEVIEKNFGRWKSTGPKPDTLLPTVPLNKPSTDFELDKNRVQDDVVLSETIDLYLPNPDYYALILGNCILGGGYAGRLYQDLRDKTGLVYSVSSEFNIDRARGFYTVKYSCLPQNVTRSSEIVKQNLKKMQNCLVESDRLEQAKAGIICQNFVSESKVESIAKDFIERVKLNQPLDEATQAAQRYHGLSADQVRSAFRKYLRPDDFVQITLGPNYQKKESMIDKERKVKPLSK